MCIRDRNGVDHQFVKTVEERTGNAIIQVSAKGQNSIVPVSYTHLDEPIGGVDPAARDYILNTILNNYNEHATIIISTHLISDIEQILEDVIFINRSEIVMAASVDQIREEKGMSVDALFREVFRC